MAAIKGEPSISASGGHLLPGPPSIGWPPSFTSTLSSLSFSIMYYCCYTVTMEQNFLTRNEYLRAISRGLHTDVQTIILFFVIMCSALFLLLILNAIVRMSETARSKKSALALFEKRIRKLDLSINEIDFLEILSHMLKKPWKKYLLVNNRTTFNNSISLLQSKDPGKLKQEMARSISRKAGFEDALVPEKKRGTRKLYPGIPVKIVEPGGRLFAGEIVHVDEDAFEFTTNGTLSEHNGEITVYLIDFSGIHGFTTRITDRKSDNRYRASHSDTPRAVQWENPGQSGMDNEVYIISRESGDTPVRARLKSLRPGWLLLENTAGDFRRGQDIRLYLSKKTSGGFWVNGEIARVSRSKRSLLVRLNHVKAQIE